MARSSTGLQVGRGNLPDISPILKEGGANSGALQQARDQRDKFKRQRNQARQERDQLRNSVNSLESQVETLQNELEDVVSLDEAQQAVQSAYRQGAQAVITELQNRGYL